MRRALVLLAGGWACLGWAGEGNVRVELQAPRPFGYVIGDRIPLQAAVEVDAPYRLDPASLPKPGPVNRWLWLRAVETEQSQQGRRLRHRLRLDYQTFYAPLAVKSLTIPALELALEGPGGALKAQIPAWSFSTAPLRGLAAAEENGQAAPRPGAAPKAVETWPGWLRLGGFAGLALAAAAWLAHGLGWLAFGARGRHFAEAIAALRRMDAAGAAPGRQRAAFARVHQAFNQTLGAALFVEGLPDFFAEHPRYAPLRQEIEAFFRASYAVFFGDDSSAASVFPVARMIGLCRECVRVEREAEANVSPAERGVGKA